MGTRRFLYWGLLETHELKGERGRQEVYRTVVGVIGSDRAALGKRLGGATTRPV